MLMKAFGDTSSAEFSPYNQGMKELTRTILQQVRQLPGNQNCCDCGAPGDYCHFHLLGFFQQNIAMSISFGRKNVSVSKMICIW